MEKDDELPNEFYEAMLDDDLDEQDLYNGNMEMEDFNRNNWRGIATEGDIEQDMIAFDEANIYQNMEYGDEYGDDEVEDDEDEDEDIDYENFKGLHE